MAKNQKKLTLKQQRFIQEYLVDLNATQAAIRVGYSKKTAKEQGYENLTKPHIVGAILEAQRERSERVEVSQDYVLKMLMAEVERSAEETSPNARIKSLELLGKHLGMFLDRHQNESDDQQPIVVKITKYGDCEPDE